MTNSNHNLKAKARHVVEPRLGSREWIGLAVIALPCLLYAMDFMVLNVAIPHLVASLHPSSSPLLLILDMYGFFLAASLITMGALGDRFGHRRLLLLGATLFGLGSLLYVRAGYACVWAPSSPAR